MKVSIPDCFMISLLTGFAFGFVYEVLRIIRLNFRFKQVVFICDVVFFILAAAAAAKLSALLGNYIRIYTILGFGAGVFAYITTIGRIFNAAETAAAAAANRNFSKIRSFISKTFVGIAHKVKGLFVKVSKDLEEIEKNLPEPLKLKSKKVYNKKRLEKTIKGENKNVIQAEVTRGS